MEAAILLISGQVQDLAGDSVKLSHAGTIETIDKKCFIKHFERFKVFCIVAKMVFHTNFQFRSHIIFLKPRASQLYCNIKWKEK